MERFLKISFACIGLLLVFGCSQSTEEKAGDKTAAATADDSHHHGSGPHGGTVTDWGGGKYHVEFTVDHDKKEAVVYVLGGDGKTPTPVKTSKLILSINEPSFQVNLEAQPQGGEPDGASSRFVGQHDNLGKVQEFAGTISGEVEGTPYAGDFTETAEGHDHPH